MYSTSILNTRSGLQQKDRRQGQEGIQTTNKTPRTIPGNRNDGQLPAQSAHCVIQIVEQELDAAAQIPTVHKAHLPNVKVKVNVAGGRRQGSTFHLLDDTHIT